MKKISLLPILACAVLGTAGAFGDVHAEYDAVTVVPKDYYKYGGYDALKKENTLEYRLAKCDEAAAKAPDEATRDGFRARKALVLVALRRYDEAMALAKDLGNESLQATICRQRSERYYSKPDEALRREAIAHELKSIEGRENNRNLRTVADDYRALGDWKGLIDTVTRLTKGKPDAWLGVMVADAWYELGDYRTAVSWYGKYPNFKDRLSAPASSYHNYCRAEYALGHYDRALALVDKLPNVGSFKDLKLHYRHVLAEKLDASVAAAASDLRVVCPRASHKYARSERAEFDIVSTSSVPVTVTFARGYLPPLETVVTTAPARVAFGLGEPGFVVCTATVKLPSGAKGKSAQAGAGFDVTAIRPALPPPEDYEAFWKDAFAEQAAIEPDFAVRPISNGVSLVSCRTVWGTRMYGFLGVPEGKGPFPLQVTVGGGDSKYCIDVALGQSASMARVGRALLLIHLPPWEPMVRTRADANARHREWLAANGIPGALFNWNAGKGPKERWFYRAILGSCRLVEQVATRPEIDRAHVYYFGNSTGGGYGVFLAAFSPYVKAAICQVPNYGNAGGPSCGRPSGEDDRGAHWQTSLHYDAAFCAPRITCPILMTCGYLDNCCTPETIYCIWNALTSVEKTMIDKVVNGHGDNPPGYVKRRDAWIDAFLAR